MTSSRWLSPDDAGAAQLVDSLPRDLYRRHLGVPREGELEGRAAELAAESMAWYRAHGTPWTCAALREIRGIEGERIVLGGGSELSSAVFSAGLREARAHAVAVVAASAGARVDEEVDRRWTSGHPDEAMFLSSLAVAVAEELRERTSARIEVDAARGGVAALPRYAPGYEGWGLADQAALVSVLDDRGPLRLLESGGLLPQKSTVAAIGLTRRLDLGGSLEGFWSRRRGEGASPSAAAYAIPERALEKWSRERLEVARHGEGRLLARFRFDGKTCSGLGRPLAFDYAVELERDPSGGLRIAACGCVPAAGDTGHRSTCAYQDDPGGFLGTLREAPPLLGVTLDAALGWRPDESPSACLCTVANRSHKWRIVLQTIHYAVSRLETGKDDHDIKG